MPQSEQVRRTDRLVLLDGLRGIAALVVMFFHFRSGNGTTWGEAAHGRLAVDFFFLLSGFVISRAYERKLSTTLNLKRFSAIRIIRLAPLLWLGVFAIQLLAISRDLMHGVHRPVLPFFISTGLALLSLPDLTQPPSRFFSILPPRWSLFYEFFVNLIYAAFVKLLTNRVIVIIIFISAVALATLDPEWSVHEPGILVSSFRTALSFFLGVLIYRLYGSNRLPRFKLPLLLNASVLVMLFFVPVGTFLEPVFSLISVGLILPGLLISSCFSNLNPAMEKLAHISGEISYPLYLLHIPGIFIETPLLLRVGVSPEYLPFIAMGPIIFVSLLVARKVDEPLREWLTQRFLHQHSRQGLQAAP